MVRMDSIGLQECCLRDILLETFRALCPELPNFVVFVEGEENQCLWTVHTVYTGAKNTLVSQDFFMCGETRVLAASRC